MIEAIPLQTGVASASSSGHTTLSLVVKFYMIQVLLILFWVCLCNNDIMLWNPLRYIQHLIGEDRSSSSFNGGSRGRYARGRGRPYNQRGRPWHYQKRCTFQTSLSNEFQNTNKDDAAVKDNSVDEVNSVHSNVHDSNPAILDNRLELQ